MRLQLIAVGFAGLLVAALWWQVNQNGELKAVNGQYEASLDDMRTAILDQHKRNIQTNNMLANTRRQFQATQQQAQDLADDLRNQNGACINSAIPAAVVSRVLEFQAGQN